MATLDFIVHPLYLEMALHPISEDKRSEYPGYVAALSEIVRANPQSILVEVPLDVPRFCKIPEQRTLRTHYFNVPNQMNSHRGYVAEESWDALNEIVAANRDQEIRVHGSLLGFCVSDFAKQLFHLAEQGKHYFAWEGHSPLQFDIIGAAATLYSETRGHFAKSRIKYGVVFSGNIFEQADFFLKRPGLLSPYGRMDHQLVDQNTRIFGA